MCVTIEEWVDVWGTIVGHAKKIDDLPMWLQYYPKVLFEIINRSGKKDRLLIFLPFGSLAYKRAYDSLQGGYICGILA